MKPTEEKTMELKQIIERNTGNGSYLYMSQDCYDGFVDTFGAEWTKQHCKLLASSQDSFRRKVEGLIVEEKSMLKVIHEELTKMLYNKEVNKPLTLSEYHCNVRAIEKKHKDLLKNQRIEIIERIRKMKHIDSLDSLTYKQFHENMLLDEVIAII